MTLLGGWNNHAKKRTGRRHGKEAGEFRQESKSKRSKNTRGKVSINGGRKIVSGFPLGVETNTTYDKSRRFSGVRILTWGWLRGSLRGERVAGLRDKNRAGGSGKKGES